MRCETKNSDFHVKEENTPQPLGLYILFEDPSAAVFDIAQLRKN